MFSLSLAALFLLAAVAGPETRSAAGALALIALALALLVDVVLLGVQFFAVKAFCRLCILTYLLNALSLVLLLPVRRDGAVLGEALSRVEGRVAFTGALLAVLALTGGVLGSARLLHRGAAAAASPLGLDGQPAAEPAAGRPRQRRAAVPGGGPRGPGAGPPAAGDHGRPAEARPVPGPEGGP